MNIISGEVITLVIVSVVLVVLLIVGPEWNFKKLNPFRKSEQHGKVNKNY